MLFSMTAILAVTLIYLGSIQQLWMPGLSYLELGVIFSALLAGQYLSSYLLEEFIMDYKGTSLGRWASAPLGIFFCILSFSIVRLSLDLLS